MIQDIISTSHINFSGALNEKTDTWLSQTLFIDSDFAAAAQSSGKSSEQLRRVAVTLTQKTASAANLPTLEDPSRGTGSGILQTLQNYGYDIIMLVALIVIASMFVGVCYHAYITYSEIHTGKKTWGQFGLTIAIGAMLLVVGIWLLTQATEIL